MVYLLAYFHPSGAGLLTSDCLGTSIGKGGEREKPAGAGTPTNSTFLGTPHFFLL